MSSRLLRSEDSLLLVVDVQERFLPIVRESARLVVKVRALVEAARRMEVPVLVSEQYPKGLGPTVDKVREALPEGARVFEKTAFGCLADDALKEAVAASKRRQAVVCGLEAHICVSQTVHQLLEAGYQTHVVEDALGARDPANLSIGARKMEGAGAVPASVESVLFEWLGRSRHPSFKDIQALIK